MEKASKPISEQLKKEFPELLLYPVKKPIEMIISATNGSEKAEQKKR